MFAPVVGLIVAALICIIGLFILTQDPKSKVGIVLVIIGLVFLMKPAFAHDHNHPERNEYLKSLYSKDGTWCCNGDDVTYLDGSDWDTQRSGGGYRVRFEGQWLPVPDGAVVDTPNKLGTGLVWVGKGYDGTYVRCFAPGTLF